jgi:hypothetical protein
LAEKVLENGSYLKEKLSRDGALKDWLNADPVNLDETIDGPTYVAPNVTEDDKPPVDLKLMLPEYPDGLPLFAEGSISHFAELSELPDETLLKGALKCMLNKELDVALGALNALVASALTGLYPEFVRATGAEWSPEPPKTSEPPLIIAVNKMAITLIRVINFNSPIFSPFLTKKKPRHPDHKYNGQATVAVFLP